MRSNTFIAWGVLFLAGCQVRGVENHKDLEQNMMDLRLYQENLGDFLRKDQLDYASWLLEGLDSIMRVLNDHFPQHRRLRHSFAYYYKKEMQKPLRGIREAIRDRDTAKALRSYRILVDQCNDCHIDNDVDKEVWY